MKLIMESDISAIIKNDLLELLPPTISYDEYVGFKCVVESQDSDLMKPDLARKVFVKVSGGPRVISNKPQRGW